jgi:hypothetical protein
MNSITLMHPYNGYDHYAAMSFDLEVGSDSSEKMNDDVINSRCNKLTTMRFGLPRADHCGATKNFAVQQPCPSCISGSD